MTHWLLIGLAIIVGFYVLRIAFGLLCALFLAAWVAIAGTNAVLRDKRRKR